MKTAEIIISIVLAAAAYVTGFFHFRQKGFLLNNAYLFASKEERLHMDKKPHYRQSGTVFLLIGTLCALIAVQTAAGNKILIYFIAAVIALTIIYAVVSSIFISLKK